MLKDEIRELFKEIMSHLDGALEASTRPESDSGQLYLKIKKLLEELKF